MIGASGVGLRGSWRPILQPACALACAKGSIRVAAGLRRTDLFKSGGCLGVRDIEVEAQATRRDSQ
jgi:hypothetical protein